jgi:hypothetical protein
MRGKNEKKDFEEYIMESFEGEEIVVSNCS